MGLNSAIVIAANKNDLVDSLLYFYFRNRARRAFHTLAGRGLNQLRQLPKDRPVLLFCNHTNWWDGLFVFLLTRQMRHKAVYCMMEERQLKHYRFFTWLGAFSVDLSSPIRSAASLRYAQRLLQGSSPAIWIFPQGKICRPDEPIEARPGIAYLAKTAPQALLVPVAMHYTFFREDRPNALVEIGTPFAARELSEDPARVAAECNQVASRLTEAARQQDLTEFELLFRPGWTINKRWEWVQRACQGRLRDFDPVN